MSKRWQSWANCFLCLFIVVQTTLVSRAVAAAAAPKDGSRLIYVYELVDPPVDADDYDEIAALVSMQGLINRRAPVLYINNDHYGRPKYWMEILSRDGRWLEGMPRKIISDLDDVYRLAADKVKGAVIWDPDVPASFNVATTIAGVEDAVIFSPTMAEKYLQKWRLTVVKDLRGMFTGAETGSKKNDAYRWAIREYVDAGKCSPHLLCLYTDPFHDRNTGQIAYSIVRDWAVKNRAFTYDLSPWGDEIPGDDPDQPLGTDLATYHLLLEATFNQSAGKQMTEVAGFFNFQKYSNMPGHPSRHDPVPTEWETVYLISPYNCYQNTATEFCYNQSFHGHAPRKRLRQQRPTRRHRVENKAYIAILMADYDSAYPLYHFLPKHWQDPLRGELPLAWGVNPNLLETYPDLISYFYETASTQDFFVADASAAGYMNPNRIRPQYLPLFIKHNKSFYEEADMTISGMVLDWDQPRDDVKDAFTCFSPDGYATIVSDFHGGNGKPPRPHVWKGMPIVTLRAADPNSPAYTAGEIYKAVKQRQKDEPGFYLFRCVWVSPTQVKNSLDLFARQHPEESFELVDLYTFFDLFKQHNHEMACDVQVRARLPKFLTVVEGFEFNTCCIVENFTDRTVEAEFTVNGLEHSSIVPHKAVLEPAAKLEVMISGKAIADQVTVDVRGRFGLRQAVTRIRRIDRREVVGAVPDNAKLRFVGELGSDTLAHMTGRQVLQIDGAKVWEAEVGSSAPGFLVYGPYARLDAGRFLTLFRIQRTSDGRGDVARVEVCKAGADVSFASRTMHTGELPIGEFKSVALVFQHDPPGGAYETRVEWTGNASLVFDRVMIWEILNE
jgi:hypothetical protein